ncbi:Flp family type IVb pilin [Minwuia thermotolerans]|uniref:Flp family type IVb pilin n=1 Tax=Minwuia thermotolerans TaxID=2056226 RepID=A0A2M9G1W7_9PROT|nr:Flp family type IVb pilin [Minwuia thermotolerans]PJK29717.1 Flp family type IVb pilin [Minwuia thermotolerans]
MKDLAKRFLKDESGATAIEYGLIAGLISIAAVAAMTTIGGSLETLFGDVQTELTGTAGDTTSTETTPTTE